jgi:uncharacterized protein YjiS (DUF1127 family)
MTIRQNQSPARFTLREPGVDRRVTLLLDRGSGNNLVPGTGISLEAFQRYQARGRQVQARTMAAGLAGLVRGAVRLVEKFSGAYRRSRAEAEAIHQLNAMDNRLLQDIGIRRADIPAAVAGLMKRQAVTRPLTAPTVPQAPEQPRACNEPHTKAAA